MTRLVVAAVVCAAFIAFCRWVIHAAAFADPPTDDRADWDTDNEGDT